MTCTEPFWEAGYRAGAQSFGPPSEEILALVPRLPARARVLDLGCGDGRNALPFASAGFEVHAIDKSAAAIERLLQRSLDHRAQIHARVQDLEEYSPKGSYDLIITHGVLHLLPPAHALRLVSELQAATRRGGWNVHAVFTDRLPQPEDLAPFVLRPFREGELQRFYDGWEIELFRAYTLADEHPGGIRHQHAVNKIVARRVSAASEGS